MRESVGNSGGHNEVRKKGLQLLRVSGLFLLTLCSQFHQPVDPYKPHVPSLAIPHFHMLSWRRLLLEPGARHFSGSVPVSFFTLKNLFNIPLSISLI